MLVMVDTEASNLESVLGALRRIGVSVSVARSADGIESASAIILPGVGAFAQGMGSLRERGLVDVLRRRIQKDKIPTLGICLGMQLLAESSEEHGQLEGLGVLKGRVVRLQPGGKEFRVPNIGWCDTRPTKPSALFPDATDVRSFYYIHSYHFECDDESAVAATIDFGGRPITVAVAQGNIFGVQFHPEKSQGSGLDLLDRFFRKLSIAGHAF
jgi:glutamine amidotransferase